MSSCKENFSFNSLIEHSKDEKKSSGIWRTSDKNTTRRWHDKILLPVKIKRKDGKE